MIETVFKKKKPFLKRRREALRFKNVQLLRLWMVYQTK